MNDNNEIFCSYTDPKNPSWNEIPGSLKHVSINNNKLYGVNSSNDVFTAAYNVNNPTSTNWTPISGKKFKQISSNNNMVCGVNNDNDLYCSDNDSEYEKIPVKLKYISVNNDKRLYGISPENTILTYKS